MPMIYVTLVGKNMVAASANQEIAKNAAYEMVSSQIEQHIDRADTEGDVRNTISIRTVHIELRTK